MSISFSDRPKTIHICTLTPDQQAYETALYSWLTTQGYHLLAHSGDPLPAKLRAASTCDLCLLLLGPEFGPQEADSLFSHTELEAAAALKGQRLYVFIQEAAADSLSTEQRDFIRRIMDFKQGWFANNIFPFKIEKSEDWLNRLHQLLTKVMDSWRPPPVGGEEEERPQVRPDAIMISSTGMMDDERAVVRTVLGRQGVPVIDYKTASAEPVTPRSWVIESARQCHAVFLIMGPDYGSDIPFEGLGVTELEFEHALDARVPVFAFLRSDAPVSPHGLSGANPDQADFVQRVRCYLPAEQIFFFDKRAAEEKSERRNDLEQQLGTQIQIALSRLSERTFIPGLPAIDDDLRLRWYRRRVQRWMGTLPHLTLKQGVPLEQVYVTLQTLPSKPVRLEKEQETEQAFVPEQVRDEEEEKRKRGQMLTVDAALKQFPRLVLQGNPGSGKTVALHWYALTAGEPVTPVFIALARYADAVKNRQATSLEEFIAHEEQRFMLTDAVTPSIWLDRLRQGRGLLLLDALDEVPLTLQEKVVVDILAFSQTLFTSQARNSRIVLTTRIAGFKPERLENTFTITEVQYLTPAQQRQIIRYWFRQSSQGRPYLIGERVNRILEVLQRQASLNSWARTPLMLTLLTTLEAVMDIDFSTRVLTKAEVYRLSIRLMLSQWSTLSDRFRSRSLRQKEVLLLAIAWQNTQGQRRDLMTREDIVREEPFLSLEDRQDAFLEADRMLDELSRRDGILIPIGEAYTLYHPTFQEYLVATRLASLPEGERQAILKQHRLNEQWEEITQLLVSELDRNGKPIASNAVLEMLIAADEQPIHPYTWRDPLHLSLARSARCQGIRTPELAQGASGRKIAQKWGEILEGTLSNFGQYQYEREQACQAILDMGAEAKVAYPYLQKLFTKWKQDLANLKSVYQRAFFPRLPATAVEALGNFQNDEAALYLRNLLVHEEGIGEVQAAALKALIRLGPGAASPARDLLMRFIGAQEAMGANLTCETGQLAAILLLQLSPTKEELERIAKLGQAWAQEALWATLTLDPALVMPFLREMINKDDSMTWYVLEPERSRLDYHGDPNGDVRTEALEAARRFGLAAEPLLDLILFRTIFDVERNQRLAEDVFLSFGARAVPVLKERFFKMYNETAREMFFQDVISGFNRARDETEIRRLLAEGIRQNRNLERFVDQQDALRRQQKMEEKLLEEQQQREKLHSFFRNPPIAQKNSQFFKTINDVKDYGTEAVEFLDELCALAENESLDRDSRSAALMQIGKLGPLAGNKWETICTLLYNPLYYSEAFAALVAMKFAAAPALPRMRQLLHSENWVMRAHAVEVIGCIGPGAVDALPDLITIVRDRKNLARGQGMVRKVAVEALGKLWPLTESYLDDLCSTLLHDSHVIARSAAAKVLEQIKSNEPRVIEALYAASHRSSASQDVNIQTAAVRALRATLTKIDIAPDSADTIVKLTLRKRRFWFF